MNFVYCTFNKVAIRKHVKAKSNNKKISKRTSNVYDHSVTFGMILKVKTHVLLIFINTSSVACRNSFPMFR